MKKHKLKTIAEIQDVVNLDNIDNFITDFEGFLRLAIMNKNIVEQFGGSVLPAKFTWIDDGKNDISISVKITEK